MKKPWWMSDDEWLKSLGLLTNKLTDTHDARLSTKD